MHGTLFTTTSTTTSVNYSSQQTYSAKNSVSSASKYEACSTEFKEWLAKHEHYFDNDKSGRIGNDETDCFYHEAIYFLNVKKDDNQAALLFHKAAIMGDEFAQKRLHALFENGRGICKETVDTAWKYFKDHAICELHNSLMPLREPVKISKITPDILDKLAELMPEKLLELSETVKRIFNERSNGQENEKLVKCWISILRVAMVIDKSHPNTLLAINNSWDFIHWFLPDSEKRFYLREMADHFGDAVSTLRYAAYLFKKDALKQESDCYIYMLQAASHGSLTAQIKVLDFKKGYPIDFQLSDALFEKYTYAVAGLTDVIYSLTSSQISSRIKDLLNGAESKVVRGKAAYVLSQLDMVEDEDRQHFLHIAKENNYPAAFEEDYVLQGDARALLNLSDLFMKDPVLSHLSSIKRGEICFKKAVEIGVNQDNVAVWWDRFQNHPDQFEAKTLVQMLELGGKCEAAPSNDEIMTCLKQHYKKCLEQPSDNASALRWDLSQLLVHVLLQATHLPGVHLLVMNDPMLRQMLFFSVADIHAQQYIVEKCDPKLLADDEKEMRIGCYGALGINYLKGNEKEGVVQDIPLAIQYLSTYIQEVNLEEIKSEGHKFAHRYIAYCLLTLKEEGKYDEIAFPSTNMLKNICPNEEEFRDEQYVIEQFRKMSGLSEEMFNLLYATR